MISEFTGSHLPHILQQKAEHGLVIVCVVRQDRMAVYQVAKVHLHVFGRENPVVLADEGVVVFVVILFDVCLILIFLFLVVTFVICVSEQIEVPLQNEPQFFLYFVEVPSGSHFHECLVGVAVLAHAAQELLERCGGKPVESSLKGVHGDTFQIVDGVCSSVERQAEHLVPGDLAQYERAHPHTHGPGYHVYLPVAVEDGIVEIQRAVVVANHVVHVFGTVLLEGSFVRCPTGKEKE